MRLCCGYWSASATFFYCCYMSTSLSMEMSPSSAAFCRPSLMAWWKAECFEEAIPELGIDDALMFPTPASFLYMALGEALSCKLNLEGGCSERIA